MDTNNNNNNNNINIDGVLRLLLGTVMEDRDADFKEGFMAAISNKPITNKPQDENNSEHRSWEDGWWYGFYYEKAGLDLSDTKVNTIISNIQKKISNFDQKTELNSDVNNNKPRK